MHEIKMSPNDEPPDFRVEAIISSLCCYPHIMTVCAPRKWNWMAFSALKCTFVEAFDIFSSGEGQIFVAQRQRSDCGGLESISDAILGLILFPEPLAPPSGQIEPRVEACDGERGRRVRKPVELLY